MILHIHSNISFCCAKDERQTKERILKYALDNNLKTICITDHFRDKRVEVPFLTNFYKVQNFDHISKIKPLPQAKGVRFLFDCETDIDKFLNPGLSEERFDEFDFDKIPTTHFHMENFTLSEEEYANPAAKAKARVKRLDAALSMNLPFGKVGIAHLT